MVNLRLISKPANNQTTAVDPIFLTAIVHMLFLP